MSAPVLEADHRVGTTKPRLFTEPLPEHRDPNAEWGIKPEATWGPLCCYFLEVLLDWHLLPWQKWLYYHALEKRADGTGFRFRQLIVMVGRQSGKTTWGRGLGLWRLYLDKQGRSTPDWPGARVAVVAAQNLEYAEATLEEIVHVIKSTDILHREFIRHSITNGKHRAILTYRRQWRAAAAYRKGGRSLSVDFAWLDEVREHTRWDAYDAIEPTTTVMPNSQLLITSNAGDERSIVLKSLRDQEVRILTTGDSTGSTTGFFEYSVPDDVDPRNPEYWHLAQPALGHLNTFCLEDLIGKFKSREANNLIGFQTEYLCQWVPSLQPGVIPAIAWKESTDEHSCRAPGADVYACIDVNYHRTRSYIAVAAYREDGRIHTEIAVDGKGTDWIADWFTGTDDNGVVRKTKFKAICAQKTGAPVSALLDDLRKPDDPSKPPEQRGPGLDITDWGHPVQQLANSAGDFYEGIVDKTIRHRRAPTLDVSAGAAVARTVSSDAWFFDRRRSPVDASPVIACCGAVWLLTNPPTPEGPSRVHEWPDDDVIEKWRKDADEQLEQWRKEMGQ